ncbi:MAG: hypothetical protein L6Q98_22780 [Anaerolineae bacterium]|nr:hypothetical protein [Anaerolineae bacterium]NUQ05199.1 hypothetical protein [Anaerolineae bacterium]
MVTLTHLDWQPVILLKVVRLPFGTFGGLSLNRGYLALDDKQLLYADWTLEAEERAESVVCDTGWILPALPDVPTQLKGAGAKRIPSGTWVLPYSDSLYTLFSAASTSLVRLIKRIETHPTDPRTLTALINLSQVL